MIPSSCARWLTEGRQVTCCIAQSPLLSENVWKEQPEHRGKVMPIEHRYIPKTVQSIGISHYQSILHIPSNITTKASRTGLKFLKLYKGRHNAQ